MTTRLIMTLMIAMMINAVIFGIGTIAVLAMPSLQERAMALLPWVVAAAFTLGPVLAWMLAPTLIVRRGQRLEGSVEPARGEVVAAE